MKFSLPLPLPLLLLAFCASLFAQNPATSKQERQVKRGQEDDACHFNAAKGAGTTPNVVRDDAAIAALDRAVQALGSGGGSAVAKYALITGTVQEDGSAEPPSSFVWEDDLSGATREFRRELNSGNTGQTFVSGHGSPSHASGDNAKGGKVNGHVALATQPLHAPLLVLAGLRDRNKVTIQLVLSDSGSIRIRTASCAGQGQSFVSTLDWEFDPASYLPSRVTYRVPLNLDASHYREGRLEFSDYKAVSGVLTPFTVHAFGIDGKARTFHVESAQFGDHGDPGRFAPVGGGK